MELTDLQRKSTANFLNLVPFLAGAAALTFLLLILTVTPGLRFLQAGCAPGIPCFRFGRAAGDVRQIGDWLRVFIPMLIWPTLLIATFLAWLRLRRERWVARPIYVALSLTLLQVFLVYLTDHMRDRPGVDALNLALLLSIEGLLVAALVIVFRRSLDPGHSGQLIYQTHFARLTLFALATMFVVLVSGSLVKLAGTSGTCAAWPWCPGGVLPGSPGGWLHIFHRIFVVIGTLQLAAVAWLAWQTQRYQASILVYSTVVAVLFFAQGIMGAVQAVRGELGLLAGLHSATAAGVWAILVVLAVQVGLAGRFPVDERLAAHRPLAMPVRLRDFLALTKPIVVSLLLITTYGGMVVGGRAWPALSLTFWTLAGGALAAGGSSAINQFIDWKRDRLMTRTAGRPIPAGRVTPAEGLAFGVALCLAAFFVFVTFVNLSAALFAMLGVAYYVFLYSLLLKHATVQNIVIGGGAGAIPPLVGWAAVTGSVTLPAVMLFVVIFFWTPPHFWALALVRRKDYQRAGIPMLPVVRGEQETRWQIFLYTLILVAITLSLPVLGLGGGLYIAAALLLGAALIAAAFRVWRGSGNRVAWQMYRFSSLYLAFLFAALMLDAVL